MFLSAENKDHLTGFVNRGDFAGLIFYVEALEHPQVAPDESPVPAIEAQAEAETASNIAEAEKANGN